MEYTVKLTRRLDKREFQRTIEAFSPNDAAFFFDTKYFELSIDWKPTVKGKPVKSAMSVEEYMKEFRDDKLAE